MTTINNILNLVTPKENKKRADYLLSELKGIIIYFEELDKTFAIYNAAKTIVTHRTVITNIKAEDFITSHAAPKKLKEFKDLGFFNEEEESDYLFFPLSHVLPKDTKYKIVFGDENDLNNGEFNQNDFNKFLKISKKIKNRFQKYKNDFTPASGWEPLYYFDLITGCKINWTLEDVKMMDKYKTAGLKMTVAKILFQNGMSLEEMHVGIGMPRTWVERVYGK